MDGPGYKFAGLMISTLNHERASTYLIHDVGVEYNSLYEVSYKREKIQERTTTHSCFMVYSDLCMCSSDDGG